MSLTEAELPCDLRLCLTGSLNMSPEFVHGGDYMSDKNILVKHKYAHPVFEAQFGGVNLLT